MNAAMNGSLQPHAREIDDLFYRERRSAPVFQPVASGSRLAWSDISALVPALGVVLGAAMVAAPGVAAVAAGLSASSLLMVALLVGSFVMTAVALSQSRLLWLAAAGVNQVLVIAGVWMVLSGDVSVLRLMVWHLVLVSVTLLAPTRRDQEVARVWFGAELGLLVLAAMFA